MKRIVIFTVGFHARATCRHLARRDDCRVMGFVDNNPAVQGETRMGLPVWSPRMLPDLDFDVVAVPGRNQAAIERQLTQVLGISPDRIWLVRKSEVPPAADELARRGQSLAQLLRRTLAVLDDAGARYWAMHSALLGLCRGEDLARFTDLDLCVDAAKFDALSGRFDDEFGAQLVSHPEGAMNDATGSISSLGAINLSSASADQWDEPAMIDLHSISIGSERASWWVDERTLHVSAAHFHGRNRRTYRGIALPVPAESETLLEQLYGSDWSTPAETWNGRYLTAAPMPVETLV